MTKETYEDKEDQIGRLMRGAGKRSEMPVSTRRKAEQVFKQELNTTRSRIRKRAIVQYLALAASLFLGVFFVFNQNEVEVNPAIVVASIEESIGDSAWISHGTKRKLNRGVLISVGDKLTTENGSVRLKLSEDGIDLRLAKNSVLEIEAPNKVRLLEGTLYIDAQKDRQGNLLVQTHIGNVEHVGTQYMLKLNETELELFVREGAVKFKGENSRFISEPVGAEVIKINRKGIFNRTEISASGEVWRWINKLAPPFSTDGKSLLEFLEWTARESGRALEFDNEYAKEKSGSEILAGNIFNESSKTNLANPDWAIIEVLSFIQQEFEIDTDVDGIIQVNFITKTAK